MTDRGTVDRFLAARRIAVVGVSSHAADFSRVVFHELAGHGYDVVPVRPGLDEVEGRKAFARLQDVPGPVDGALLMTPPARTDEVVRDAAAAGVPRVWMHRGVGHGAVSDDAVAFCRAHGIDVVPGECPLMFLGDGIHRAHARWRSLTGRYPQPAPAEEPPAPGRRAAVLVAHAVVGWLACAGAMALLLARLPVEIALWMHVLVAPLVFSGLAAAYFRERAPLPPLAVAGAFTGIVVVLDAVVVAGIVQRSFAMFASFVGSWLPFALIFAVTMIVGGWSTWAKAPTA